MDSFADTDSESLNLCHNWCRSQVTSRQAGWADGNRTNAVCSCSKIETEKQAGKSTLFYSWPL